MNEWQVFLVVVGIVSFVIAVTTPIVKLVTLITRLTSIVDALQKDISGIISANDKEHSRIAIKNEEQDKIISRHETSLAEHSIRIGNVENALDIRKTNA